VVSWADKGRRVPQQTKPLDEAYDDFRRSVHWDIPHFTQSLSFVATDAARRWGIRPSEMGVCDPADDPAVMMAYADQMAKMEAIERFLHNEEIRIANKSKGAR